MAFDQPPQTTNENNEELDITVSIPTSEQWEEYKYIRLRAVTLGREAFGLTDEIVKQEQERPESKWREFLQMKNAFPVLARHKEKVIGFGRANQSDSDPEAWTIHSLFIEPEYRKRGIPEKIFAARIKEIKKRGGKKIYVSIEPTKKSVIEVATSFGFKKSENIPEEILAELNKYRTIPEKEEIYELDLSKEK